MEKIRAIVYSEKRLVCSEIEKPVPGDNEVLVKVKAVSLNAADYRSMKMRLIPKKRIFGADVAGIVESTGNNTSLFRPGDEVMGDLAGFGFGGLSEYVAAPEHALIHKPANVSFEAAAAIPLSGVTALQALRNKGNIQAGQKVLIVGSAGGVGVLALQLAKYFGAEVTGVCSSDHIKQTLSLGADFAIDYSKEDFTKINRRFNIILGINGNYPLRGYRKCLGKYGRFVMIGGSLSQISRSLLLGWLLSFGDRKMMFLGAKANREDLEFLAKLLESGKIKPVIDSRYSLDKTAEAMEYLSRGHAAGKVIINIGQMQPV